jgi:ribose transport system permease protein
MAEIKAEPKVQDHKGGSVAGTFASLLKRGDTSVILATLVLFLIFALGNDSFLTPFNMFNVSRTAALYVFVAMGQAIVIVIGGMNLSLGAIGGLGVVVAGWCMDTMGWNPWVAVVLALGVGIAAGAFNGLIIIKSKLSSFVVTLASSFIFIGLVEGISKGFPYTKIPKSVTILGRGDLFQVPYLFIMMVLLLVFMGYFFKSPSSAGESWRQAAIWKLPGCRASVPIILSCFAIPFPVSSPRWLACCGFLAWAPPSRRLAPIG